MAASVFGRPAASAFVVPDKMAWWYEARFGMFIHFGSYSYLGHGEWAFSNESWSKSAYQTQVSANFNPTNFDANAIAAYAKAAGMKYLVITAKHHEGFGIWNTTVPSFTDVPGTKIYDLYHYTSFHRDILGELKTACAAQGVKFCLYYSILDWNHPSQTISKNGLVFSTMASSAARSAYIADMKSQLNDLITKYDPDGLWFDGDWCGNPATPTLSDWWTVPDGVDLYNYLIGLKPTLVVNERVKRDYGLGDYAVAESGVPGASLSRLWETCESMNGAWGYDSSKENSYQSPASLIQQLARVVSRDGNYLLNIGPKGDGSVTGGAVGILNALAVWMGTYGESVHGVSASPYSTEPSWGYFTKKPGRLYAHVFSWPTGGQLVIPALKNTVTRVYALAAPATSLNYTTDATAGLTVSVPAGAPDGSDSVIVVEMSGTPTAVSSRIASGGTASAYANNPPNEDATRAFDGAVTTKWYSNTSGSAGWLQYQFANGWGWKALQYQITSANDVPERDPKNWQLLGSNDGTTWSTLDTQSSQSFASRQQTITYPVATPGNYRFYRLNVSANNGGTYGIQLSEFALVPAAADLNDTTAPVITTPGSLTVPRTGAAGAVVSFTATATDAVNGNPTVVCTPASGSVFPIGTTYVQCSTRDFAGNGATAGFYVNVVAPPAAPGGLTATPGAGQVTLAWNPVQATSYVVARASGGSAFSTVATGIVSPGYQDATVVNGTTYQYVVSAVNAAGGGAASTPVSATPIGPAQIITPKLVMAADGSAQLNLATSVSGRTYQLQRSATLASGSWVNLGAPQAGGGPLNFSDPPSQGEPRMFYRILIGP